MQITIAAAWSISMIIAAIGLWNGKPWGLRLYWLTYGLMITQCIVGIIENILRGDSEDVLIALMVLGVIALLFGLIGAGIRGSLVRQRSLDAPPQNG